MDEREGAESSVGTTRDKPAAEVSLLEALLQEAGGPSADTGEPAGPAPGSSRVGYCVDDRHPVLQGRARVRWQAGEGSEHATWIPVLQGVTVRTDDRVLVLRPEGWDEPIVVGVVDGYRRRPEPDIRGGPSLELRRDEAFTILAEDGTPVLRVLDRGDGPELQLFAEQTRVRMPGDLELSAGSLVLKAERGGVRVEANDDVVVRGEVIKLN